MSKIAFVILHYCVINETIECVCSILDKIDVPDYDIIIVDNCSPDGSGQTLLQKYKDLTNITVLLNPENLGFAKGCNVGFNHAKNTIKSDFIVLLNNDTLLIQNDFYDVINKEYRRSDFAVLGPDIETPDAIKVNPVNNILTNKKKLAIFVFKIKIRLILNYIGIESFLMIIKKKIVYTKKNKKTIGFISERAENVLLHGCCLVFSPTYINLFDGLDNRTFLYLEEEILFNHVRRKGLTTVYNPKLKIYHKEDAATNSIVQKTFLKRRFIYKNVLQSSKVLKNIFNQ